MRGAAGEALIELFSLAALAGAARYGLMWRLSRGNRRIKQPCRFRTEQTVRAMLVMRSLSRPALLAVIASALHFTQNDVRKRVGAGREGRARKRRSLSHESKRQ